MDRSDVILRTWAGDVCAAWNSIGILDEPDLVVIKMPGILFPT
jgi:hypothetical protein